ncbi:MAG: hypothetical protein WD076_07715, partial [Parvularculaceae bacterium]
PIPFDEIKTGGAAIIRFARTVRGPGLSAISELLDIASKSNAAITAVGVEDQASLSALRGLGFAAAQGNHLGRVGPLEAFTPSRVNEVRALLGLEPLSPQDLLALFRTEAPAPQTSQTPQTPQAAPDTAKVEIVKDDDALVERLAARLARQAAIEAEAADAPKEAAAKAAAIARVKRKVAANASPSAPEKEPPRAAAESREAAPAAVKAVDQKRAVARGLQERLSREFSTQAGRASEVSGSAPSGDALDEIGDSLDAVAAPPLAAPITATSAPAEQDQDNAMNETRDKLAAKADAVDDPFMEQDLATETAGASEPIDQATPNVAVAALPAAAEGLNGLSLAIANARAIFRPGIRVGVRQTPPPQAPEPPINGSLVADEGFSFTGDDAAVPAASLTPAPAAAMIDAPAAAMIDAPAATPIDAAAAEAARPPSDADNFDHEAIAAATAPRANREREPRRKKNFLTRRYRIVPTHFWPRSWKRALKRREEDKAPSRAEPQAEAAE